MSHIIKLAEVSGNNGGEHNNQVNFEKKIKHYLEKDIESIENIEYHNTLQKAYLVLSVFALLRYEIIFMEKLIELNIDDNIQPFRGYKYPAEKDYKLSPSKDVMVH